MCLGGILAAIILISPLFFITPKILIAVYCFFLALVLFAVLSKYYYWQRDIIEDARSFRELQKNKTKRE